MEMKHRDVLTQYMHCKHALAGLVENSDSLARLLAGTIRWGLE